ncbi:MAG: hypothetical protein R2843_09005 [Thermomicrobiales bacterium]
MRAERSGIDRGLRQRRRRFGRRSRTNSHRFLEAGVYDIEQTTAPDGFELADDQEMDVPGGDVGRATFENISSFGSINVTIASGDSVVAGACITLNRGSSICDNENRDADPTMVRSSSRTSRSIVGKCACCRSMDTTLTFRRSISKPGRCRCDLRSRLDTDADPGADRDGNARADLDPDPGADRNGNA